jgi:hypothetical protein
MIAEPVKTVPAPRWSSALRATNGSTADVARDRE